MTSPIKSIRPLGFPWETQDPFLFCVHHEDFYPEGNDRLGPKASLAGRSLGSDFAVKDGFRMYHGKQVPGFPAHPHCGFETVTIARKGFIDHSDSLGAAGRFGQGDVQWMTAGKGVQHCEMFPLLNENQKNPLELFQIWLNLPKAHKKVEAHFAMLWKEDLPTYTHTDNNDKKTEVEIVAGSLEGFSAPAPPPKSWAADPNNDLAIWCIRMDAGGSWTLPAAKAGTNRSLYFYKGQSLSLAGKQVAPEHAINLEANTDVALQNGGQEAFLLLLQGRPINEPVVQHGPFVVNSPEEVREVFQSFQETQFGGWPWPSAEHTHPREKGRFARFTDGSVVEK